MNKNILFKILFIFSIFIFFQCQPENKEIANQTSLFTKLSTDSTGVNFINTISNSKDFNIFSYRNFYNGGGVAIGDINNDGLSDIFLTANLGQNKLYLNKGNWQFEDISVAAGITLEDKWSTGVVMIDINNDDLLDIYVCNAGYQKGSDQKNTLFINQGDNTFVDEAPIYNLDDSGYTTHAAFFDYDRDGDLDVYILNNSFIPVNTLNYSNKRDLRAKDWPVKDFLKGGGDKLLRNDNNQFVDVSEEAGIYGSLIGFGLGVTVGDVNEDSHPDIYVSNDFFERDYLYINNGDGTFSEELEQRISHLSHSSMGADMADINNDGSPEIFVTDMLPDDEYRLKTTSTFDNINLRNLKIKNGFYNQFMHNTLQLNNGDGSFKEISQYSNVAASDWSWGALMFDADNDSHCDLFVCNGIFHDVIDQDFIDFFANDVIHKMVLTGNKEEVDSIINKMPSQPLVNKFFRNTGSLKFEDYSQEWGIKDPTFSNGAAYGDLDNDGDLDLVVNNVNQKADIFRNNTDNHFIAFRLKYKTPNIGAIGSKIYVFQEGKTLIREHIPSRGFQSSVDNKIIIGLGENTSIDSVHIRWPDGKTVSYSDLKTNELNDIQYSGDDPSIFHERNKKQEAFFSKADHDFIAHQEDDYIDFYYERNIPLQLSKEGPCAAIGDVNGDGRKDIYIGAAAGFTPQLYINTPTGYQLHQESYFERFKAFEDTCAEFFDCDGDGDLDLIVGSGGNNATYINRAFRDRLYINTNGNFEINFNAIPPTAKNTSVIKAHDIDNDGDQDLFVGSRSIPAEYGVSPGSHIYINNGRGQFLDVTETLIAELSLAGMITDAVWSDVLPQEGKELILVGEWMAPKILSFDGQKFNIIESELSKYAGWWQSIMPSDIDNDGDNDLVLGNIGENFYLKADSIKPLFLWINDFDENGSVEKLITYRIDGKDMPVVMKRDLADQIPELKKENLLHSEYATKPVQELFSPDKIRSAIVKKVNFLGSVVALNNGNGDFTIKKLNTEVQLSSVNDIAHIDINHDGYEDLIVAGNNYHMLPQFSMIDACQGKLLLNNKQGGFEVIPDQESGLNMEGVVRELNIIKEGDQYSLLALINSEKPQVYTLNSKNYD